jgi:hypothetical protein
MTNDKICGRRKRALKSSESSLVVILKQQIYNKDVGNIKSSLIQKLRNLYFVSNGEKHNFEI